MLELVEPTHTEWSSARQCDLLTLPRSGWYYQPQGESAENLGLMRLLDEQYTRTPFYGARRMTVWLTQQGHAVNVKRVRRRLRLMGGAAISPERQLSQPGMMLRRYPYLLREVSITHADHVWSTDITYIRIHPHATRLSLPRRDSGLLQPLCRVVAWERSNTLDGGFCLEALERARERATPEIFNTDQGAQFTSRAFTGRVEAAAAGARVSWDGRGRARDKVFVERLWRSVKYGEVYLHDYVTVADAMAGLGQYFSFYNDQRPHQSLA